MRFCANCGRSLAPRDRFCGACGKPTAEIVAATLERATAEQRRLRRAGAAVATLFVGVLLALLAVGWSGPHAPSTTILLALLGQLVVGAIALGQLGWRAWRPSFGRAPSLAHLAAAVPVALCSVGLSLLYVWVLSTIVNDSDADPVFGSLELSLPLTLLLLAVFVPLSEEWLCRGLMWIAVAPIVTRRTAVIVTAALFALLHGLNGTYLLEAPHRFVGGLLFGWLRLRSGSLWPAVLAHALHNAVATVVMV